MRSNFDFALFIKTRLKWFEQRPALLYGLGLAPVFILLLARYFVPVFFQNDAGKIIGAHQVVDPSFLSHDWAVAWGHGDNVFDVLFAWLLAPLWCSFHNLVDVALTARLLCWVLQLVAIACFARALKVEWYVLPVTLGLWLSNRQGLGAAEWVLCSAEPKCLAYIALFFALYAVLRGRLLVAAVLCAVSIWAHVLVGFWGSVALLGALLWSLEGREKWRFIKPALLAGALLLPFGYIAMLYGMRGDVAQRAEALRLAVMFSDPYHLDPSYFDGWKVFAKLLVCVLISLWIYPQIFSRDAARLLSAFQCLLAVEFLLGLLASVWHQYWFLLSFPFRVPDVLALFNLLLAVTCFAVRMLKRQVVALRNEEQRTEGRWQRCGRWAIAVTLVALFAGEFAHDYAKRLWIDVPRFVAYWEENGKAEERPGMEMARWIRENTAQDAIFMAPPWWYEFWAEAERAEVVCYKRPPHNTKLIEWHQRLIEMNGKDFMSRGIGVLPELFKNYPRLSAGQVEAIAKRYGASYYLTTVERPEWSGRLVHANQEFYLYRLE